MNRCIPWQDEFVEKVAQMKYKYIFFDVLLQICAI